MKRVRKFSTMATGSMAIGLLLCTSMAQAVEVCYNGEIVTGIRSLDVFTESLEGITIDVDFVNATGFELYGSELDNVPYPGGFAEEDAVATMLAINLALNGRNPVPDFVEISGKQNYYIGAEGEVELGVGLLGAVGGENVTGDHWDPCDEDSILNCIASVAVLNAKDYFIYADLSKAVDGAKCDGSAPPTESDFTITAGITGSWFDRSREGEGFNIEIIGPELDPQLLAYFYTYDDSGNQMWLTGVAAANGDTAIVPMQVTSGTVFGPDFDPNDVMYADWGTITFTFSSCSAGTAEYTSTNFGSGSYNIEKLTSVSGATCP